MGIGCATLSRRRAKEQRHDDNEQDHPGYPCRDETAVSPPKSETSGDHGPRSDEAERTPRDNRVGIVAEHDDR